MSIKSGDKAPEFTLKSKNVTGEVKDYSLSDFKGKNVVLLFFPQAFTGVCTDEMCSVSNGLSSYSDLNAEVLGISVDSVFTQEAWAKANNITIPLLSDFNKKVINLYDTSYPDGGFVFDMNGVSKRAAFVIDKDGIVRYSEVLENAGDLPDFDKVKETLKSLN
ncbi:redoxin domain-containing protein [Ignavibacteria bacterium CHB1]|jgi:peroxiredoxin|nr:MAG: peroxiredoxin [Chlorobiota bacterium]KXK02518.1 MAG: alkyl hydroperoxide reductase/ Thiol specific antioxidant/ Mal allergen [Chlorobi bacterium OLB4]MBV6398112.1 Selenocysteine-containing peroxiredoxin PrxU [Ignavibacteria bacterium]MCC6886561.1 redoxin domain-containing protein [Ignavibacteriales bacterium]MCE7952363.1 peroxiredoxin [Chlorobi bacterium CHB7]MDL1886480.1 redoxin domain-containing protein [Ignavibacteria bacterium CHB1]OQY77419.1 MAG: peroxiredoxin [Ignavibacteriales 